jgi:hypothetical protein
MPLRQSQKSQAWKRSTVRFQPTPCPLKFSQTVYPKSVVYSASSSPRPDPFPSLDLWHSDVSYELQPPSTTSLKLLIGPEAGGDTLWSSGYALYSSLSPGLQIYLEGLSALHSAVTQADGARASRIPIRREPIETVHPVIRVHPATGWKSVYVNPGRSSTHRPPLFSVLPIYPRSLTNNPTHYPRNLHPFLAAWYRLHPANNGRAKSRIGRNTCVSIRTDKPEPRLSSSVQVGTE